MHTFKDNVGRTWTLVIHVLAVKRCRAICQVDLYGLVDERFQGLDKLLSDPASLADVLYCLCKDEAEKNAITEDEFYRSLAGDSLELAADAFLQELTDFFPDPRVRAGLQKIWTKSRTVRDRLLDLAEIQLAEIDPDTVARNLSDSFGKRPAS